MTRVFLGAWLGAALVWATIACSAEDKKETEGNKICTTNADCSEPFSHCEHINGVETIGTCTKECTGDSACPSGFTCRQQATIGLEPSCLQRCESKSCPKDHNCITNTDDMSKMCVPNAWFAD